MEIILLYWMYWMLARPCDIPGSALPYYIPLATIRDVFTGKKRLREVPNTPKATRQQSQRVVALGADPRVRVGLQRT